MPILDRVTSVASDYASALRLATRGNLLSAPAELWRLGLSRCVFNLGPRPYSLYRLSKKPQSSWRTYLDDSPTKPTLRALNREEHRVLVDDKILFHRECIRHALPTVPMLATIRASAGPNRDDDVPELRHGADLRTLLEVHTDGLFFKPSGGRHGNGAFAVWRDESGWRYPEGVSDADAVFAYCRRCVDSGILLVQPRQVNASKLRPLMAKDGFGTIRAVTYMRQGQPQLLAACLRIIVDGNVADNFHSGTTGNLLAPIDAESGRLITLRASRSRVWPDIYDSSVHPVTSVQISGFQLPFWKESLELALRAQQAFRPLHTLGWDVGVTEQGPILIEANSTYDIDLLQIAFDRGFRPDLDLMVAAAADK
jgi:hypothetical protein